MKMSQAISRTTGLNIGLFELISMHISCWGQICTFKLRILTFLNFFVIKWMVSSALKLTLEKCLIYEIDAKWFSFIYILWLTFSYDHKCFGFHLQWKRCTKMAVFFLLHTQAWHSIKAQKRIILQMTDWLTNYQVTTTFCIKIVVLLYNLLLMK